MKHKTLIASLVMGSLLATLPGMALADGRGRHKQWKEDRRHYRDYEHVRHGNHDYSYRGGRFYRPGPAGLIAVSAPLGAVVASLPFGVAAVVSGGNTFFYAEGNYYRRVPAGYMVCETPVIAPSLRSHRNRFPGMVMVQPTLLNIRSGPGMSFGISGQVVRGERLHIRGNSDGWYYVETPGGIDGWVMVQFTSPYAAG